MNWKVFLRLVFIAVLTNSTCLFADEPILSWHTNMGSASENDSVNGVAVDESGNVYIAGGGGTWGTPINPGDGGFAATSLQETGGARCN